MLGVSMEDVCMAQQRKGPIGTAATTRLRKLECEAGCGYIVRVSRAAMDKGLPSCCCGALLAPAALEDAIRAHEHGHLSDEQLAAHPEHEAYWREQSSVLHGQARAGGLSWAGQRKTMREPADVAYRRVLKQRRVDALAAQRHSPLTFNAPAAVAAEPMPF